MRLRVGDTVIDSPRGRELAHRLETEAGRSFRPATLEDIKAEEICFSRRGADAVRRTLAAAWGESATTAGPLPPSRGTATGFTMA